MGNATSRKRKRPPLRWTREEVEMMQLCDAVTHQLEAFVQDEQTLGVTCSLQMTRDGIIGSVAIGGIALTDGDVGPTESPHNAEREGIAGRDDSDADDTASVETEVEDEKNDVGVDEEAVSDKQHTINGQQEEPMMTADNNACHKRRDDEAFFSCPKDKTELDDTASTDEEVEDELCAEELERLCSLHVACPVESRVFLDAQHKLILRGVYQTRFLGYTPCRPTLCEVFIASHARWLQDWAWAMHHQLEIDPLSTRYLDCKSSSLFARPQKITSVRRDSASSASSPSTLKCA